MKYLIGQQVKKIELAHQIHNPGKIKYLIDQVLTESDAELK